MMQPRRRVWSLLGLVALVGLVSGGASLPQEKSRPVPVPSSRAEPEGPQSGPERNAKDAAVADLRNAVERFIKAADKADVATAEAIYDKEFACARVADDGGFVHLTREQMLQFWKRSAGQAGAQAIPTKDTKVHHAEVVGDTGFVLLTRTKDLGHGWEPMFYTLVWRKQGGEWRLLREFVHQKSMPRWR